MKRIFAMLLALLILTGCAEKVPVSAPPEAEAPPPTKETPVPRPEPEAGPTPGPDAERHAPETPLPGNDRADPWQVTADGSLSPAEAAAQMLEAVAENYRALPDGTPGKPTDVQADSAEVFDVYRGEPEEFCCGMRLRLKFDGPEEGGRDFWEAGAGLSEPDADGWYGYGCEGRVQKSADGDWQYVERGSGGYSVAPQNTEGKPHLEWLVEVFCLTEGFTHDWRAPYQILELDEEELSRLPAILDQLTEAESRDLCTVLGKCLREYDYWQWSVELLAPLLGDHGAWLDA